MPGYAHGSCVFWRPASEIRISAKPSSVLRIKLMPWSGSLVARCDVRNLALVLACGLKRHDGRAASEMGLVLDM